jgi:frataxin-like iron-binding protein CyaY
MVRSLMNKIVVRQPSWKGSLFIKKTPFMGPVNVASFSLCLESGLLATNKCPKQVSSTYRSGFGPNQYCTIHNLEFVYVKICSVSGMLASQWCPETDVIEKAFLKGTEPKEICQVHKAWLTVLLDPVKKITGQPVKITFQIGSQRGDKIELYIDNQRIVVLKEAPYEFEWIPEKSGKYKFKVVLRKNDEWVTQQEIDVEVSEP